MLRKENKNPNRSDQQKHQIKPTNYLTPQSSTTRAVYRPRFIKKEANFHEQNYSRVNQQHSNTFLNSPISIEKNTMQLQMRKSQFQNWEQAYLSTKGELERRTDKFNKSIQLFMGILKEMQKGINNTKITNVQKIECTNQKIDQLLEAFQIFRVSD